MADVKCRRAGRLQDRNERPETADDPDIRCRGGHRPARIVLADGAADGINAAGAGAAAPGDFVPVSRVGLGSGGLRQ